MFTALKQSDTKTFLPLPKMLPDLAGFCPQGALGRTLTEKGEQGLERKVHGSSIGLFPSFQDYFLLANFTEVKT